LDNTRRLRAAEGTILPAVPETFRKRGGLYSLRRRAGWSVSGDVAPFFPREAP
jgi:hypothetical protein